MAKSSFLFFTIGALSSPAIADVPAADNSQTNKRIEAKQELNAQDQGSSKSDVEITRQIRRNVTKMKKLSTDAKNVKIITVDGRVTLKGPVKSQDEKTTIANIAADIAGASSVTNQIVVE